MTVGYPAGWQLQPASEAWTTSSDELTEESPFADIIYEQKDNTPFIALTSQPLGGQTAASWATTFLGRYTGSDACGATEPYTIDRVQGVVAQCGDLGAIAVVSAGGRAHVIWLYRIDDMAWFKHILDTVRLNPGAAMEPAPALTASYTSDVHGITVSYPKGWHLRPATEPWTDGTPNEESPFLDEIYQKNADTPFIGLVSQPLGGQSAGAWATAYLALGTGEDACGPTEPYTIDGHDAVISSCGDGLRAIVSTGGRAHVIWLYRIDDMAWFKQILDTVQLNPEAAV